MSERKSYNTKQQRVILDYISGKQDSYVTVNQIAEYLSEQELSVGLTTIYRALERLEKQGLVHKIKIDGVTGACFQYSSQTSEENAKFYLKCEMCGEITNLDCSHLNQLYQHVLAEHDFHINPHKTMFYGICGNCKTK